MAANKKPATPPDVGLELIRAYEESFAQQFDFQLQFRTLDPAAAARERLAVVADARTIADALRAEHLARSPQR